MPVNLTRCILYWCINTYESTVKNGNFTETVLNSNPISEELQPLERRTLAEQLSDGMLVKVMHDSETNVSLLVTTSVPGSSAKTSFLLAYNTQRIVSDWLAYKFNFSNSMKLARYGQEEEGIVDDIQRVIRNTLLTMLPVAVRCSTAFLRPMPEGQALLLLRRR